MKKTRQNDISQKRLLKPQFSRTRPNELLRGLNEDRRLEVLLRVARTLDDERRQVILQATQQTALRLLLQVKSEPKLLDAIIIAMKNTPPAKAKVELTPDAESPVALPPSVQDLFGGSR